MLTSVLFIEKEKTKKEIIENNSNAAKHPDLIRELSKFKRAEIFLQWLFSYLAVLYTSFTTDT